MATASFPIRTVTALTGVNEITLRAWERRYGLIQPLRTPKGHRLYTQDHVDLIQRVLALMGRGVPIGQVRAALESETGEKPARAAPGPWPGYRKRMAAAIAQFDEQALDAVYEEALSLHSVEVVTRLLLLPLLEDLGLRWNKVAGGVAEEHFFAAYLRNKLGARFHHRHQPGTGPRLLAACAPGEQHEIGLLLFSLAANEAGMRVVLLGANVPLSETGAAARRAQCEGVVVSSSLDPEPGFWKGMTKLVEALDVPVFVGGATSTNHAKAIAAAGAVALGTDVDAGVRRVAAGLGLRGGRR